MNAMHTLLNKLVGENPDGAVLQLGLKGQLQPINGAVRRAEDAPDLFEILTVGARGNADGKPGAMAMFRLYFSGDDVVSIMIEARSEIPTALRPSELILPRR